ncbi:hypothetical protein A33Q_0061 [Indibacter alkaliphilus LW1]|uniref:Uncharacterized protein n=1 Tax=Indibacter alkaliphilus (strain CCUG 57479 / KCTC 22604 / LW1) TaxID=1189612 RepID=S2DNU8_INDAL|nr:hypothetical protein A33Q_0061 [Indibacter alkaliphilus LW1]
MLWTFARGEERGVGTSLRNLSIGVHCFKDLNFKYRTLNNEG